MDEGGVGVGLGEMIMYYVRVCGAKGVCVCAVSYTHLTLPTIDDV